MEGAHGGVSEKHAPVGHPRRQTFHQVGTCLGLGFAVEAAATVLAGTPSTAHLAAQVSVALTTGSVLLLLSSAVTTALILPADLAARRARTPVTAGPAPWPSLPADRSTSDKGY